MDNDKTAYNFNVNSFYVKAEYYKRDIDRIFIPLICHLDKMRQNAGCRVIVYIAGPCGAGKTTMSRLLESLFSIHTGSSAQALGIDGFHYNNKYLNSHYVCKSGNKILMREVKGSAETYDFDKLYSKISALKQHGDIYWSFYDRVIHDVAENFTFINGQILIIEGNWLLLDEPRWSDLVQFCDYSIFINADRETLISRLTERKIIGGLSAEEARTFVMRSDVENIKRILSHRLRYDMELQMNEDGSYTINDVN